MRCLICKTRISKFGSREHQHLQCGKRKAENTLQNLGFMYDDFGNLAARKDNKR